MKYRHAGTLYFEHWWNTYHMTRMHCKDWESAKIWCGQVELVVERARRSSHDRNCSWTCDSSQSCKPTRNASNYHYISYPRLMCEVYHILLLMSLHAPNEAGGSRRWSITQCVNNNTLFTTSRESGLEDEKQTEEARKVCFQYKVVRTLHICSQWFWCLWSVLLGDVTQ